MVCVRSYLVCTKPMEPVFITRLESVKGCIGKESPDEYNERANKATEEFIFSRRNFFIIDKGRDFEERCAVKIVNGKYTGYGYFNINDMGFGLSAVHECIKPSGDNSDIQVILKQYLKATEWRRLLNSDLPPAPLKGG